jgi:hypothetical protein
MGMLGQKRHELVPPMFLGLSSRRMNDHLTGDRCTASPMKTLFSLDLNDTKLAALVKEIGFLILDSCAAAVNKFPGLHLLHRRKIGMEADVRNIDSGLLGRVENLRSLRNNYLSFVNC